MSSSWTRRVMGVAIVFATFLTCIPAFAQTGGLTGKCIGQGGAPLAGYTITIERTDIRWNSKVKTNKKGEYTYIGLALGVYKLTLLGPDGKAMYFIEKKVGMGDPTEANFDMGQIMQEAKKQQETNPEFQKQVQEQKQSASDCSWFEVSGTKSWHSRGTLLLERLSGRPLAATVGGQGAALAAPFLAAA